MLKGWWMSGGLRAVRELLSFSLSFLQASQPPQQAVYNARNRDPCQQVLEPGSVPKRSNLWTTGSVLTVLLLNPILLPCVSPPGPGRAMFKQDTIRSKSKTRNSYTHRGSVLWCCRLNHCLLHQHPRQFCVCAALLRSSSLLMYRGRQWKMAPVLGLLSFLRETQMEFPILCFSIAHPRPLWPLGEYSRG